MIANFCTTLIVVSKLHWLIFLYLLFFFVQDKLLSAMIAGSIFWPTAQFFNFKFVPQSNRILYISIVGFIWSNGMCFLKDRETKPRDWIHMVKLHVFSERQRDKTKKLKLHTGIDVVKRHVFSWKQRYLT